MRETFLLVDYENVQKVDLLRVPTYVQVRLFLGASQAKIPTELTMQAQPLGSRLQWIRIEGQGSNALDFHIAFYLAEYIAASPLFSRDKGFDPLVRHLIGRGHNVRRVGSQTEAFRVPAPTSGGDSHLQRVMDMLGKIDKKKRPRKRQSLVAFLTTHFRNKITTDDVQALVQELFKQKVISEANDSLTYHF